MIIYPWRSSRQPPGLDLFGPVLIPSGGGGGGPVGYTLTGPTAVAARSAATFTVTPAATVASDTVTLSDGSHGGVFSPTSLTWTSSSAPQTCTYTQAVPGSYSITATSGDGGTVTGSPKSLTVTNPNWAVVQTGGVQPQYTMTSLTATFAGAVTAGDLLIAGLVTGNSAPGSVVTDSAGNTYTLLAQRNTSANNSWASLYAARAATSVGAASLAVTGHMTGSDYATLGIAEFAAVRPWTLDQTATAIGTGNPMSVSIPIGGTDLAVALIVPEVSQSSGSITVGSGWTAAYVQPQSSGYQPIALIYAPGLTTGPATASISTATASIPWAAAAGSWRLSPSGPRWFAGLSRRRIRR